ncbi:uncharacterized protein TNCV_2474311 [Trichonephila clavipes]|nr:uncharacterized protein TNCV_2474311 [Trichonephila clavipes]
MTSFNHSTTCIATHGRAFQEPYFNKMVLHHTQQGCPNTLSTTLPPLAGLPDPRFINNRAILGLFGTANWTAYVLGQTRGAFTANVERDVSGHHAELVSLNAHSYHIVYSR